MRHVSFFTVSILFAALAVLAATPLLGQSWATARDGIGSDYRLRGKLRLSTPISSGGDFRLVGSIPDTPADTIFADDFESGDLLAWAPPHGMPAGTVAFFDRTDCPAGWQPLEAAQGRTLVGRPAGGSLGGTRGTPLLDLEIPAHVHHLSGAPLIEAHPSHVHWWSILWPDLEWTTYSSDYTVHSIFQWGDGIGSDGSGTYPFAAAPDTTFATSPQGGHSHAGPSLNLMSSDSGTAGFLPYIQLTACRKS